MTAPAPSHTFVAAQIRWALGRGVPGHVAEDLVYEAWERCARTHDTSKGPIEPYMQAAVRNAVAYWWRHHQCAERAVVELRLLSEEPVASPAAEHRQAALLEALEPDERRVFASWALQKHLGKGVLTSEKAAASIGLQPASYENAKKRLRRRLHQVLQSLGWSVEQLLEGGSDVERTG